MEQLLLPKTTILPKKLLDFHPLASYGLQNQTFYQQVVHECPRLLPEHRVMTKDFFQARNF